MVTLLTVGLYEAGDSSIWFKLIIMTEQLAKGLLVIFKYDN